MIKRRNIMLGSAGLLAAPALIRTGWAQDSSAAAVLADAKASIATAGAPASTWTGPTGGPKAQKGKKIVYISSDQRNGGPLGRAGDCDPRDGREDRGHNRCNRGSSAASRRPAHRHGPVGGADRGDFGPHLAQYPRPISV